MASESESLSSPQGSGNLNPLAQPYTPSPNNNRVLQYLPMMAGYEVTGRAASAHSQGSLWSNDTRPLPKKCRQDSQSVISEKAASVASQVAKSHVSHETIDTVFPFTHDNGDDEKMAKYSAVLELINLRKDGFELAEKINKKKELIQKIDIEQRAAITQALEVETRAYNSKLDLDKKNIHLAGLETRQKELLEKLKKTNDPKDALNLSTLILELYETQLSYQKIVHGSIVADIEVPKLRELEISLKKQLCDEQAGLVELEAELAHTTKAFREKDLAFQDVNTDAEKQLEELHAQLLNVQYIIEDQARTIEALTTEKANALEGSPTQFASELATGSSHISDNEAAPTSSQVTGTSADLAVKLAELLETNRNLMVAFKMLQQIRDRKYEYDVRGKQKDFTIIDKGDWINMKSQRYGACLLDAIIFTSPENTRNFAEYIQSYNDVDPTIVLEHPYFTMFHDILDYNCDLRKAGVLNGNLVFLEAFRTMFDAIYPAFDISTNADIDSNEELKAAYEITKAEHQACIRFRRPSDNYHQGNSTARAASTNYIGRGGARGGRGRGGHFGGASLAGDSSNVADPFVDGSGDTRGRAAYNVGDIRLTDGTATW